MGDRGAFGGGRRGWGREDDEDGEVKDKDRLRKGWFERRQSQLEQSWRQRVWTGSKIPRLTSRRCEMRRASVSGAC
eukprot:746936-Hanusia_phi.AAC.2